LLKTIKNDNNFSLFLVNINPTNKKIPSYKYEIFGSKILFPSYIFKLILNNDLIAFNVLTKFNKDNILNIKEIKFKEINKDDINESFISSLNYYIPVIEEKPYKFLAFKFTSMWEDLIINEDLSSRIIKKLTLKYNHKRLKIIFLENGKIILQKKE